jgi:hypothetical protein
MVWRDSAATSLAGDLHVRDTIAVTLLISLRKFPTRAASAAAATTFGDLFGAAVLRRRGESLWQI